jgi:hypothetical protein
LGKSRATSRGRNDRARIRCLAIVAPVKSNVQVEDWPHLSSARFGPPTLALDLMEPFPSLTVDSAVITAINSGATLGDLVQVGPDVALKPGPKAFFRAYELRMDTLVTHPLFGYRVTHRRILEIRARLLAKTLEGELDEHPVFVTVVCISERSSDQKGSGTARGPQSAQLIRVRSQPWGDVDRDNQIGTGSRN